MASASTSAAATKSILNPVMTLKGHREYIRSISYFPDGQQMISGSLDKTTRQWDLKTGEEIAEVRGVCEKDVAVVAVSRDGRWAVNGGGDYETGELKVCEVETGIMKILKGCSGRVTCIDISADSTLLASSCSFASDCSMRIWNLETGKLVGGPFESVKWACAVRFSTDSKKVAIKSNVGKCLEVWDVQNQKLDVSIGKSRDFDQGWVTHAPIFWTNKNKTILASFSFEDDRTKTVKTIYEFDASTLEIVGAPFKGHTDFVTGLTLSSDCTLLASAAYDHTIKLWAFESRQLLASFDVQNPNTSLILSPDSRQLAYTTDSDNDYKIYICNTPPDVLAQTCALKKSPLSDLLNSDATSRPHPGRRRPPRSAIPIVQRSPHTIDPQQPISHRLRKLLRCYPHTNVARPVPPRNPLDVPATLPLPSSLLGQAATRFDHFEISPPRHPLNGPVTQFLRQHLSFLVPSHSHIPPVVEIVPGRKFTRLAAVNLPEYKKVNDTRHPPQAGVPEDIDSSDVDSLPDVHWCKALLCYYSCWSHGRLRMPPRWRLERVNVPRQGGTTNTSGSGSGAL